MLNILQRNPVELCSVLLLLAGLGQASPVDLEVCSFFVIPLQGRMTDLSALIIP